MMTDEKSFPMITAPSSGALLSPDRLKNVALRQFAFLQAATFLFSSQQFPKTEHSSADLASWTALRRKIAFAIQR